MRAPVDYRADDMLRGKRMATVFGTRLRQARKKSGLSGPQLAKLLGVSAQTVSEWERGKYFPEADRLAIIARSVNVRVDWLLGGTNGVESSPSSSSGGGRLVSKVPFDDLSTFDPYDNTARMSLQERVLTHFPCSETAFQITLHDAANAPLFQAGDSVIIDPAITPTPGDMVLVIVDAAPLFRRYRPRGTHIELAPLNEDWEVMTVEVGKHARLLGTMSEHSRRRR